MDKEPTVHHCTSRGILDKKDFSLDRIIDLWSSVESSNGDIGSTEVSIFEGAFPSIYKLLTVEMALNGTNAIISNSLDGRVI